MHVVENFNCWGYACEGFQCNAGNSEQKGGIAKHEMENGKVDKKERNRATRKKRANVRRA